MIHHDLLHRIKKDRQRVSFVYPYYGAYSIAEIPAAVERLLGGTPERAVFPFLDKNEYARVILFFVDGLGFDHFIDYERWLPFFHRLATSGNVYPLTSVFPSTTPAALTTLHTGLTPQEHGLPEWTVYFPEFGRVIEPLPFRAHLSLDRETLLTEGGSFEMLYPGETLYERLCRNGIASSVFLSSEYSTSTYATATLRGATAVPYDSGEDLFPKLADFLASTERGYAFVYWTAVDRVEHAFGPRSDEHIGALRDISRRLEEFIASLDAEQVANTYFLLTSDHGQSNIQNEDIIYLNEYLDLDQHYALSPVRQAIPPTGAPHDVFLHIAEGRVPSVLAYLSEKLKGKAEVLTTEDAIDRGLFGLNEPVPRFKERIGSVLILPYEGYHVWYQYLPGGQFGQLGIHGGLSQEEMIVPLAMASLSDLRA